MNASQSEGQDLASNATINLFQSCLLNISWLMLATLNVGHYDLCLHLFAHPDYRTLPSALFCVPQPIFMHSAILVSQ